MEKKFIQLFEATLARYNRGGFLTSDRVKFTDKALNNDFFKNQPESVKNAVKELIDSGLNLRVKNVKSIMPATMGAGNTDYNGYSFSIEVVPEIAPGRYDINKTVVVPADLLVHQNDGVNLPPIPDNMKYDNKVQIEPKTTKDYLKGDKTPSPFNPISQTKLSDVGNKKLDSGDRELNNTNTKIPSSPAVGQKDPASYTAQYLPRS
ncbi:MAG: hypothetical protein EBU90_06585 [Proteobacteria bacterium]|nr:hypothetical protein [Pseudomonadota bacterium]NBP15062.1 hypothetical protein [bacterium]